jgi:UDP-N-acetyl-D-glucosamine dehydrogenase
MRSVPLDAERLRTSDAIVIVTDHRLVDYDHVAEHADLIIDTRGVYRGSGRKNVVKA